MLLGVWCACNSRLNLVRLFVNPPHPIRARTPPWGYVCARLCMHARPYARLSIPACAYVRPVVSASACACLCALPVTPCARCAPRGVSARCALVCAPVSSCAGVPARCTCLFCSRLRLLPLASLWMLWPATACLRPPLCRAARSLRSSLLLAPRSTRGSVTIVCYNQNSVLQGIAYNLAVCSNGSTLQRGTSRTAAG